MEDKYIVVNLETMDYMKTRKGEIIYYNTEEEACDVCWIYELDNSWVCKLVFQHKEKH